MNNILPLDKIATQLEDIANDITGNGERKKILPWDRIADSLTTIADAVGAEVPDKKYTTKKALAGDLLEKLADQDFSLGGGTEPREMENELIAGTLSTYDNSTATVVGRYAFGLCSNLSEIKMGAVKTINMCGFVSLPLLEHVSFPVCTSIAYQGFACCSGLQDAFFPACTSIISMAFMNCTALAIASFPSAKFIDVYAFGGCVNLKSFYCLASSVPRGSDSMFVSTPIDGYTSMTDGIYGSIYVRASLLTAFKEANYWSYYSARMVGLTDEEIAALDAEYSD